MKIQLHPALTKQVLQLLEEEYRLVKPIPHLTELIYCLTRSYFDRVSPLVPTSREILLFSVGWGLERLLLKAQRKLEPGCCEGIYYAPDFLAFTEVPGELKTTRIGEDKLTSLDPEAFPLTWRQQILGYMKCKEREVFELAVLHLMGNYKPPFPSMSSFRIEVSREEIEENWAWLQARKETYLAFLAQERVPVPYVFCEPWECKECRYAVRCSALAALAQEGGKT